MPNAGRIVEILNDCFFRRSELDASGVPVGPCVIAEAVATTFGFHRERLESYREEIRSQLLTLPEGYFSRTGGGMSFLEANIDRSDRKWGEIENVESLLALAIALGDASFCAGREVWPLLPNGFPYFVIQEWWPAVTARGGSA